MSLTWYQLDCLLNGVKQLNKISEKKQEQVKKENTKKGKRGSPDVNDPISMLALPGFKLSPKARERLIQIMKDKNKKASEHNG
jgi:hypothetical protein